MFEKFKSVRMQIYPTMLCSGIPSQLLIIKIQCHLRVAGL